MLTAQIDEAAIRAFIQSAFDVMERGIEHTIPPRMTRQRLGQMATEATKLGWRLYWKDLNPVLAERPWEVMDSGAYFPLLDDLREKALGARIDSLLLRGHDGDSLPAATGRALREVAAIEERTEDPCQAGERLLADLHNNRLDSREACGNIMQVLYFLRKHGSETTADELRAAFDARKLVLWQAHRERQPEAGMS